MKWVGKTRSDSKKVHVLDSLLSMDETCVLLMSQCESLRFVHISGKYIADVVQHVLLYSTDVLGGKNSNAPLLLLFFHLT